MYAIIFDIVSTIDNQQANVIFRDSSLGEVFVDIELCLNFLSQCDQYERVSIINHNCYDKFKVVLLFFVVGKILMISTCLGLVNFWTVLQEISE